jgi:hypothetical protein
MDSSQPPSRPEVCPECGAAFSGEGTYCWLCGWKQGDPVGVRPTSPQKLNPYASPAPNPADLKWTFSLSTLFLWTALVAVVMGVARLAPGLGIALGIISFPAALHTTALVAYRKRRSGHALSVQEKIFAFIESFALFVLIAIAIAIAAIGALAVICMSGRPITSTDSGSWLLTAVGCAAGIFVIVLIVFPFVRAVWRSKD